MKNKHPKSISGFLIISIFISCGHISYKTPTYPPIYSEADKIWADTTLSHLSIEEKIGQLFIITSTATNSPNTTIRIAEEFQPGGILMSGISSNTYQETFHELRSVTAIPLFEVSAEQTSFNNQLSDLPNYPESTSRGALNREYLGRSLENKLVTDFKKEGINLSLSPSIHSLADNQTNYFPQLQYEEKVALMSQAADRVERLQDKKILAIANAFDFYVDTIPDSTLIKQGYLNEYKSLVISGLSGVMLSDKIFIGDSITHRLPEFYKTFLKKHLQFDGLIFGQITQEVSLKMLLYAGATAFVVPEEELAVNFEELKTLVAEGTISEAIIDKKIHQLLMAKKWIGLDEKIYSKPVNYNRNIIKNNQTEELYTKELFEQSIILTNNEDDLLPFKKTYAEQYKVVHVGPQKLRKFQNSFFDYANCSNHLYRPQKDGKINGLAFNPISSGAYVITLDDINLSPIKHKEFISSIHKIGEDSKVVLINYGNPYNLSLIDSTITSVQVFERNAITEVAVPQLLFGAIEARGTLPMEVASWLPKGKRNVTPILRLKHTTPEEVGISSDKLEGIDRLFASAIRSGATPGGQVLVAKQGKIIYSKTFGHHTYDKVQRVEQTDLYDVASITKTAATTLAAMRLYEAEEIKLEEPLKGQMKLSSKATIKNILLKNLFIHKSGLQRNMPISVYLNNRGYPKDCTPYFCRFETDKYSLKIAEDFYFDPTHIDSLYERVSLLPKTYKRRKYLYSDVNFYLIHQLLEQKIGYDLDDYLKRHFYEPLGLRYLTYKPLERLSPDVIAPTQQDDFWRKSLVRGYVHDEAAAILGGVGGNAGLFSNASDLAVVFQMLLQGGEYGGKHYLSKETIEYFTSSTHGNHRGLGFDKARYNYTASKSASHKTFGHSGFSGTCVWVDPEEELIYIFLSNRVYPNPRNDTMKKMRVRQRIHQIVYDAINDSRTKAMNVNMAGE